MLTGSEPRVKAITIEVGTPLREVERLLIEATLGQTGGNVSRSATILGIDRGTLYHKIEEYQIPRPKMRNREFFWPEPKKLSLALPVPPE